MVHQSRTRRKVLKATWASRESYDVPHIRKVSKCLASGCPTENSHHLWYQCLEHVLWRRSCHRRGVSSPVPSLWAAGLNLRFPPMWVVTLPVYGGNPPRMPITLGVSHGSPSSHVRTTHCAMGCGTVWFTRLSYIYTIYILINWLVVEPPIWKLLVKLEIFHNFRGENKKSLKPPPS